MSDPWLIVKGIYVVFFAVYVMFSFVVWKQVRSMTSTLEVGFEGFLNGLVILHLLTAVVSMVGAIVFL